MIPSRTTEGKSLLTQVTDFFMGIPFFDGINGEEIKVIAKHIASVDVKTGEILFKESDKGNYICFIVSGRLQVSVKKETSEENVVLAILKPGQSLGEMAIIEDLPRFATITAIEDCKLFVLSKSAFDLILERHPYIGIKLLKGVATILSTYLRHTSIKLANFL